jgi:nitroreductase
MGNAADEQKEFYSATDTGFISQKVYLYYASEGLATLVRGLVDMPALEKVMRLRPDQKVILAQSVGYPKKQSLGKISQIRKMSVLRMKNKICEISPEVLDQIIEGFNEIVGD